MARRGPLLGVLVWSLAAGCGGTASAPAAPTPPVTLSPVVVPPPPSSPTWDLDTRGVPRFIARDYLDVSRIAAISKFRSAEGHDYSDGVETCRSMKHYFRPADPWRSASIPIASPIAGRIGAVDQEWAGAQIAIVSSEFPAFRVILFHVNATVALIEGLPLEAGQALGTHIGEQTWSDVAVAVETLQGRRLVSWFDAITDDAFERYRARGLVSRGDAIITRAARDAAPLSCAGETFANPGTLTNWFSLR